MLKNRKIVLLNFKYVHQLNKHLCFLLISLLRSCQILKRFHFEFFIYFFKKSAKTRLQRDLAHRCSAILFGNIPSSISTLVNNDLSVRSVSGDVPIDLLYAMLTAFVAAGKKTIQH